MCYYHAAAGFPTKPTWLKAIKNKQLALWPGLTADVVNRHYPDSNKTPKGHGRKALSGLRSTKVTMPTLDNSNNAFGVENSTRLIKKECTVIYCILDMEDEAAQKIYTNQPGRFPKKPSRGNQYIMVLTKIDSNAILIEPMKNRTAGEMIRAYQVLIDQLNSAGIFPKLQILDNECSAEMKAAITLNKMKLQLVPPHDHCCNLAKKAIQTFKDHFVAILCGADNVFSLHLWNRLLPQAKHTLNMSRPSQMMPTISAYAYLWKQQIIKPTHLHHSDASSKHILSQQYENPELPTLPVVSMLAMLGIIISATRSISPTLVTHKCATRSFSNTSA